MDANIPNEKTLTPSEKKEELRILEWRFSQFLGEKLKDEELKQEENQSYIITDLKMTNNGEYVVIGDKGGRVILFKKNGYKNSIHPKLNYFFEYMAMEKDFDVHKSTEYSESIRSLCILPMIYDDKIDIITCGYRTVRHHRICNTKYIAYASKSRKKSDEILLEVPKIKAIKTEIGSKCRKTVKVSDSNELNSVSVNKIFTNQFITSDNYKVLLWDMNHTKEAFNTVDLENNITSSEYDTFENYNSEEITISKMCDKDPHLFAYGTSHGNIKLCDIRTGSDGSKCGTNFLDEFSNITNSSFNLTKTLFSYQIMSVHDINFNLNNENHFASRHFLSVNIWDRRNIKAPINQFLTYEPVIPKLSYLYKKNYMAADRFTLSADKTGHYVMTGGYNNMFHVFDINQRLNTQITIDDSSEKLMNTNIIRKINSKGSCFYRKDDPNYGNINYDAKILRQDFSNFENFGALAINNCVYTYTGNMITKETGKK